MTNVLQHIADTVGGKIEEVARLPDGSGFATMSFPLPKDHWLYAEGYNVPPMPFRVGTDHPRYRELNDKVRAAARYAVRAATMNGKEDDFDPDAMVQNFLVGMLGYHTPDGLSGEGWDNPSPVPDMFGLPPEASRPAEP